jgi:predicted transcriptional regulator
MQQFVATIVAAYLHKSAILPDDLPGLIASVGQAFGDLGKPTSAKSALPIPAVPIDCSVGTKTITCLACGWSGSLRRSHLTRVHAITPAEYRTQWDLPRSHPMVAARYSARRSALSKSLGLGGWHHGSEKPRSDST